MRSIKRQLTVSRRRWCIEQCIERGIAKGVRLHSGHCRRFRVEQRVQRLRSKVVLRLRQHDFLGVHRLSRMVDSWSSRLARLGRRSGGEQRIQRVRGERVRGRHGDDLVRADRLDRHGRWVGMRMRVRRGLGVNLRWHGRLVGMRMRGGLSISLRWHRRVISRRWRQHRSALLCLTVAMSVTGGRDQGRCYPDRGLAILRGVLLRRVLWRVLRVARRVRGRLRVRRRLLLMVVVT